MKFLMDRGWEMHEVKGNVGTLGSGRRVSR